MSEDRMLLQALLDKWDIYDVLLRYCRAADRCDAALWSDCFHDDARIRIGGLYEGAADGFAGQALAAMRKLTRTQHFLSNALIELGGDSARVESYVTAFHRISAADGDWDCLVGGRYLDRFERRGGVWRIAERRAVFDWNRDDPTAETMSRGVFPMQEPVWGRRDRDDPSYRRLPGFPARETSRSPRPTRAGAAELAEVIDRQAIRDVLNAYSHNLDRCRETGLRRVFHPGAHESHAGAFDGSAEEFCAMAVAAVSGIGPSSHAIGNALIEIQGDRAYCESYVYAQQRMSQIAPAFDTLIGGRYLDHLERRDGRWAIVDRFCTLEWLRDEDTAETLSRGMLPMVDPLRGSKGASDPVYRDMRGRFDAPRNIGEAADKLAIQDLIYRYARGADRGDLEILRSCFHPDAHENHMGMLDGNAWAFCEAAARGFPTLKRMHHAIANVGIELHGDVAFAESYTTAYQRLEADDTPCDCFVFARSLDRLERRDGRWRIADRRVVMDWNQDYDGAETLLRGALAPGHADVGARDRTDPSYRFAASPDRD